MSAGISPDAILAVVGSFTLATLGGVVWLARTLGRLDALTTKELTHNGGSTLKDNARDGAQSAKRAVLVADEARSQAASLRKELAAVSAVTDHQSREAQTALALVAARDEHMRNLLGRLQSDVGGLHAGQQEIVARVNEIETQRAHHDQAVAAALHESLDVALIAADAKDGPTP